MQSSQKLDSSHLYHRLYQQKGIQYLGFTLPLRLWVSPTWVSPTVGQGPCMDAAIAIARESIGSLGQTLREPWRIYGRVRRKNMVGAVDLTIFLTRMLPLSVPQQLSQYID